MGYLTGFCAIGSHEGTQPRSYKDQPMKVCIAHEVCTCDCHEKIDKIYSLAKLERAVQENPEYVEAPNVDLSWLQDDNTDWASPLECVILPGTIQPPVNPITGAPTTGSFAPTPTGVRAKGQLEYEVNEVCERYMRGEIQELMTTKFIGFCIDKYKPPSEGAIRAVMIRWEEMGYARVKYNPTRFVGFTVYGMSMGLAKIKSLHKKGIDSK